MKMVKKQDLKKDKGKERVKIRHTECVTCSKFKNPHIGLIPSTCKDRFHPIVIKDCKKAGKKEKFRLAYEKHELTPFNILKNGCPEYEAVE